MCCFIKRLKCIIYRLLRTTVLLSCSIIIILFLNLNISCRDILYPKIKTALYLISVTYNAHSHVRMATGCANIYRTMQSSYHVIEINNCAILNTLQNFHF